MIEIIQTGQFGKTRSLIDMHRVRKLIFKDRMQWDVDITDDGLEIDDYDLPETVYILARDDKKRVVGVWRILPSDSPSMIRNIWPRFLDNYPMPIADNVWEASRFGVYSHESASKEHIQQVNQITARLICALIEVCIITNISHIYTMYNPQVGRSVRRIGFIPESVSEALPVDGKPSIVGCFKMDQIALDRVQSITGISCGITEKDLPPILASRKLNLNYKTRKENVYA